VIALDYAFRSGAPATNDLGQVGMITQTADNLFKVENHTIGQQRSITASAGGYLTSGVISGLLLGHRVVALPGVFGFAGLPAILQYDMPARILSSVAGAYSVTGNDATLTATVAINFSRKVAASITRVLDI
jgi:hypothetical protein